MCVSEGREMKRITTLPTTDTSGYPESVYREQTGKTAKTSCACFKELSIRQLSVEQFAWLIHTVNVRTRTWRSSSGCIALQIRWPEVGVTVL